LFAVRLDSVKRAVPKMKLNIINSTIRLRNFLIIDN